MEVFEVLTLILLGIIIGLLIRILEILTNKN